MKPFYITNGYIVVRCPGHPKANTNGHVYQHRLIAEVGLGRFLLDDECVHHKNGCRQDNDPANLMVIKKKDHRSLHRGTRTSGRMGRSAGTRALNEKRAKKYFAEYQARKNQTGEVKRTMTRRELRKDLGITLEDVAIRMGVAKQTVKAVEDNEAPAERLPVWEAYIREVAIEREELINQFLTDPDWKFDAEEGA